VVIFPIATHPPINHHLPGLCFIGALARRHLYDIKYIEDIRTIQAYPISEEINIDVVNLPSGTALWSDALILHLLSLPSDARRRPSTQP
jgi:hypothetical protein